MWQHHKGTHTMMSLRKCIVNIKLLPSFWCHMSWICENTLRMSEASNPCWFWCVFVHLKDGETLEGEQTGVMPTLCKQTEEIQLNDFHHFSYCGEGHRWPPIKFLPPIQWPVPKKTGTMPESFQFEKWSSKSFIIVQYQLWPLGLWWRPLASTTSVNTFVDSLVSGLVASILKEKCKWVSGLSC